MGDILGRLVLSATDLSNFQLGLYSEAREQARVQLAARQTQQPIWEVIQPVEVEFHSATDESGQRIVPVP